MPSRSLRIAVAHLREEESLNSLLGPLQSSRVPEGVINANGCKRDSSRGIFTIEEGSDSTRGIGVVILPWFRLALLEVVIFCIGDKVLLLFCTFATYHVFL